MSVSSFCHVEFTVPWDTTLHECKYFSPHAESCYLVDTCGFDHMYLDEIMDDLLSLFGCGLCEVRGLELFVEYRDYGIDWQVQIGVKDGKMRSFEREWTEVDPESSGAAQYM